MLSASSANNHSLFSFGRRNEPAEDLGDTTASFDFLPSVSFDDLQSSLETASTDFKLTQFPSPTGHGSILDDQSHQSHHSHRDLVDVMVERPNVTQNGGTTRVAIQQPPVTRSRTGSILRRPSTSSRPGAAPSTASGAPVNAPTAPAAMRPRRQSHYPPVSNSNIAKPPRKSVGPGLYDSDYETRNAQRRRPSLASLSDRGGADSTRTSVDGGARPFPDTSRNLTASRAAKARSVQAPARHNHNQSMLSADGSTLTPDSNRLSTAFPRSPRGAKGSGPGSGKRASVMPGVPHASHATGLGARTISPTDTRRMKRLSSLPPPQGQPQAPSVPAPPSSLAEIRPASRSPSASMLPRKAPTPSSSRTTPDPNRKSYSSGLSITSTNSFNTARTSTGSIQPRMSLGLGPSSRLPAPKAVSLHNTSTIDDDEDVPPVPAIPKAYESPKESPAETSFFDKRKSNLAFDASSIHSNSTGSITGPQSTDTSVKVQRKPSVRKSMHTSKAEMDKKAASQKKNLQPLRLPPITLGPLSTPTAAKIAALQEQGSSERNLSPPPSRKTKTPTTPMTASKSSFFSRRHEEKLDNSFRSSSSIHHGRSDSPLAADATSSSESVVAAESKTAANRSGMSPFLSSSVPKGGADHLFLRRHKTNGDYTLPLDGPVDLQVDSPATKPSGPRAQKASTRAKSPPPLSSPDEPPTPSSISSLRRKLSLSWKRSGSKNSLSHPAADKTDHQSVRQDSMPPPRIPASATYHSHGNHSLSSSKPPSPTPSTKSTKSNGTTTTYLESRRRKSSASSLNAIMSHDTRHRSDSLAGAKRETSLDTVAERSTIPHNSSVVQKILKPKPSTSTIRSHDVWTADLDKDDLVAEDEMKKLGSRRKETELAARTLDALRKRATPKERVSPQDAIRIAMLNIYERGEIVDYNDIYFCGTQNAAKVVGDLNSDAPNFGYDDERGDYTIIPGDHLAYRYEIIDILGKGSFGQVVRCIDHKTGVLVAVKIIRNKKRFHQQALVEVNILQKLREWVSQR